MLDGFLQHRFDLFTGDGSISEPDICRLFTTDTAAGQYEIGGMLLSDDRGQRCHRNWRIASQCDFWEAPGSGFGRIHQIADQGQLSASTQAMAVHGVDTYLFRAYQQVNYGVKLGQHRLDFIRSVSRDIDSSREVFAGAGKHDDQVDALGLIGQLLDMMTAGRKPKKDVELVRRCLY